MIRVNHLQSIQLLISGLLLALSSSCAKIDEPTSWPLLAAEAHGNFVENQSTLKSLVHMLEDSKYATVTRISTEEVSGNFEQDGRIESEMLMDSALWIELMSEAKLETAIRTENTYTFLENVPSTGGTIIESAMYIYADTNPLKMCEERFQEIPCGMCDMFRKKGWTVRYMWMSGSRVVDYMQSISIDDLADESALERLLEKFRAFNESNQECLKAGLVQMGHEDISTLFE